MTVWFTAPVADLQAAGLLLVEDGNHGEYRPRPGEFAESGVAFIRAADMTSGVVDFASASKINDVARKRIRKGIGQDEDVLLSHKGTVGKVAFVPKGSPAFICSPQTTFWRSMDHQRILPRYLRYYLQSPTFAQLLASRSAETDMAPYVSLTEQRRFPVTIPPIEEQREIVATLGALDDKIESNRVILQIAAALMRALWLASEPRYRGKAAEVLTPVLGGTPQRDVPAYWGGGIPWASARDVAAAESGLLLSTLETISQEGVDNSAAKVLPAGTIVMTARGTVGALARLARPMAFNQSCYGLVPKQGVDAGALFVALSQAIERIKGAGHGTVFNTVNMATFEQIELDLPVDADGELAAEVVALTEHALHAERESRHLSALRNALLPELLSGRIQVPEAAEAVEEAVG